MATEQSSDGDASGRRPRGVLLSQDRESAVDGIDIDRLRQVLRARWRRVVLWGLAASVATGIMSLFLADKFDSTVTLAVNLPEYDAGGAATLLRRFGGIASLAGAGIGGITGTDRAQAIAYLKSGVLVDDFVQDRQLLHSLDPPPPELIGLALEFLGKPYEAHPLRARKMFQERVMSIDENVKTGLISITVRWSDRIDTAEWANQFVDLANERLRTSAVRESEDMIVLLQRKAMETGFVAVRESIYGLLEAQVNKAMLARVRPDYAFRVIDPAVPAVPGDASSPDRPILAVAIGMLVALILYLIYVFRDDRPDARATGMRQ